MSHQSLRTGKFWPVKSLLHQHARPDNVQESQRLTNKQELATLGKVIVPLTWKNWQRSIKLLSHQHARNWQRSIKSLSHQHARTGKFCAGESSSQPGFTLNAVPGRDFVLPTYTNWQLPSRQLSSHSNSGTNGSRGKDIA